MPSASCRILRALDGVSQPAQLALLFDDDSGVEGADNIAALDRWAINLPLADQRDKRSVTRLD